MITYRSIPRFNDAELADIRALLEECDGDFLPKLSERTGITDCSLKGGAAGGLELYLQDLAVQESVVACDVQSGRIIGFISYKPGYCQLESPYPPSRCAYASTILVSQAYRGQGIANGLYEGLIQECSQKGLYILARTWSTNSKSMGLLAKHGFRQIKVILDGRGLGIDTIYFVRD